MNTSLGLYSRVLLNVYQEPVSSSGKALVAKHGAHGGSTWASREHFAGATLGLLRTGTRSRILRSMVPAMVQHERIANTMLGLHSRASPNIYQGPLLWPGKCFGVKNCFHDGSALSESYALRWGYTQRLLRTFDKSRPHGPEERTLRSMLPAMALHERVVNTLLGLQSWAAPNACQEPLLWSGKALMAKHGVHDGSTSGSRAQCSWTTLTGAKV